MIRTGILGGRLGYNLLRRVGGFAAKKGYCDDSAHRNRSKLEVLLGPNIWDGVAGKVVIDFGCGTGSGAIEIAQHGARKVIGVDIRQTVLDLATAAASQAGVSDRCLFVTNTAEQADVIVSLDGFEHFSDPQGVLKTFERLLKPDGCVLVSCGPTWFHPLGGHLFSVFPWAHLIFTERALIRWRADFRSDGATRFGEVEGGLNQMTIRRFRKLLHSSGFHAIQFEAVPIKRLRRLTNSLTREFLTSHVRCKLVRRVAAPSAGATS